jgi:DNA polymerase-3 subunit alpha
MEEEIFGFPVTRHPLELIPWEQDGGSQRQNIAAGTALPLITSADMPRYAGRRVRMRGLAISYKRIPTKNGGWMKFLSLEDLAGTFEAVLFPDAYARHAEIALGIGPFALEGRIEADHGVPSLTVASLATVRDGRREAGV